MASRRAVAVLAGAVWCSPAGAETEPFGVAEIPGDGRTVAAEILELDGDGRADLLRVRFLGIPPDEERTIHVHFQGAEGDFSGAPDLSVPLPPGAAAFDAADVLPSPGVELLLLSRDGVWIVSFAGREPRVRQARIPEGVSAGPAPDERGLDRLTLVTFDFGPQPLLIVPGLGEAFLLTPSGDLRARVDTGARANYFVQPRDLIYAESDTQIFFDVPRISVGDIDGDGRTDLLTSGRHELRVFLQRPDGSFARQSDLLVPLRRVSMEDHMRGSGAVRASARDIDGDGRLDLLLSQTSGALTNAESITSVYFNRDGGWDLDSPDFRLEREKRVGADQLLDVDGDGRLELFQGQVPLTVLEFVEVVLTRSFDAHLAIYRLSPGAVDGKPEPWFERKLGIPINFDTARLRGFIPSFEHDVNADGYLDFLHSTDGTALEVYLGDPKRPYRRRAGRQKLDVEGVLRSGDLNGDGLVDFVLCNPRRPEAPVRLLRNRGVLGGGERSP